VGVDVDATRQDHQVRGVNDLGRPVALFDDLAVFDADVFDHSVETVERVIDAAPLDPDG